jgi:predicted DCC family thiol-disulfide oxidoreductase YuxK
LPVHVTAMTQKDPFLVQPDRTLTVYHDGACPLCQREIAALKWADRNRRISFVDVSPADAAPACPLPQAQLLARFHVRLADGRMVEGARAFTEAWGLASGFAPIAWLGRFAPTRWVMDRVYDLFLKVRPSLQRLAGARG